MQPTDDPAPFRTFGVTPAEMLADAERELRHRQEIYPRLVSAGRLREKIATRRIEVLQAIVDTLRKIASGGP